MTCMVAEYSSSFSERMIAAVVSSDQLLPAAAGSEEKRKSSNRPPPPSLSWVSAAPSRSTPPSPLLPAAWWEGELAEGIHRTLQEREKLLDTVKLASPQLHKRAGLIDFTSSICKCLPFSDTTRHLAVLLLDHFMEKHSIMEYRLKLVALTCLLVAAKLEDRDDYLPTIGHLQSLAKLENLAEYSRDNFQRMELYLMKFFGWSISYPTSAHFIGYYNASSFQSDIHPLPDLALFLSNELRETDFLDCVSAELDLMEPMDSLEGTCGIPLKGNSVRGVDGVGGRARVLEEMEGITRTAGYNGDSLLPLHYQMEEITSSLLEKALRDYRFLQYPPSMVSAGAVCIARIYMKLVPAWTSRLERVTSYTQQVLHPVVELLLGQDCPT